MMVAASNGQSSWAEEVVMGRYGVIAGIIALLLSLALADAATADSRREGPVRLEPQRNELRINNGPRDRQREHHFRRSQVIIVPQTTYIIQRQCVTPGYWAYQWIPQTYAYNAWVASQYAPDGSWIEGHYEPRYYASGYYQPYWVETAATAC
jgi:hypothetical protein